ncbi:MAG: tRNA (adenosine(37)-N6)-dimethylallyltransferase MiaA [Bacillaceae bacterium]
MSVTALKQKVIVIIGPTSVGKTKSSIEIAKRYNGEIISGDSMQIYKRMDIGTAKITEAEMEGIPHHLIDIKEPTETFSVADFQRMVREKIDEISSRGKMPIIAGGTGLYILAALYDYHFSEQKGDEALRERLEHFASIHGTEALHHLLEEKDPLAAERIHHKNVRRVARALEYIETTGELFSNQQEQTENTPLYDIAMIGLNMDRDKLYERINLRVDLMMEAGLLQEVKQLYNEGVVDCQSVQGIGYKELYEYIDGKVSLEDAVNNIKQNTRRYAKRQLTWFRNKMDVQWFDVTEGVNIEEIFQYIEGKLRI